MALLRPVKMKNETNKTKTTLKKHKNTTSSNDITKTQRSQHVH